MKHWKDIAFGLFVSLTLAACYGEEKTALQLLTSIKIISLY